MSQTECVASFTSHGREFTVLHKDSAAYLRADGRMIASLDSGVDGGLSIDETIAQAHVHAELFQVKEREYEAALLDCLYGKSQTDSIKAIATDYQQLLVLPAGKNGRVGRGSYLSLMHFDVKRVEFCNCSIDVDAGRKPPLLSN